MTPARIRVELVGKHGCHLCDDARPVVAAVCTELGLDWWESSVDDDAALAAEFGELIPVVRLDGRPISHWFVDPQALRESLRAAL
ncbi:MAG: glutaredoxin family protein [Candidatus Nanopelagicales bacterium]